MNLTAATLIIGTISTLLVTQSLRLHYPNGPPMDK